MNKGNTKLTPVKSEFCISVYYLCTMQLSGIQDFLEAYRKRLNLQSDDREALVGAIMRVSGVSITVSDITINKGVITVKTDAVTRNQLFLYKKKILEEIKSATPKTIADIR